MRARMAIAISGQQVEFREVILRDKPPSMIELSPKRHSASSFVEFRTSY